MNYPAIEAWAETAALGALITVDSEEREMYGTTTWVLDLRAAERAALNAGAHCPDAVEAAIVVLEDRVERLNG
jgi:hypothetical protein